LETACGSRDLDFRGDAAHLILPSAAGGQHLFQQRSALNQRLVIHRLTHDARKTRPKRRTEDRAGAQARSLGQSAEQCQVDSATKPVKPLGQYFPGLRVVDAFTSSFNILHSLITDD